MKTLELKTFGALIFFSLLVFFLDGTTFFNPVKLVIQTFAVPAQSMVVSVRQTGRETFSFITFWRSGEARIKNLELRNLELKSAKNEADALKLENEELRKQLGVGRLDNYKRLPVPVLGYARYLEIGAGTNNEVREGQAVVYLNNLLGKIIKVTPRVSYVQLLTDPQAKVSVKIQRTRGMIIGQFNSSILLDRVAQTEELAINDQVFSSGEEEGFLPDLLVGTVIKITSKETDMFKTAIVQPSIDYKNLTTVFVIQDKID